MLFRQPCLGSQEYENAGKVFDAMATALTDELSGLLEESQVKEESSGLLDEPQVNEESSGLPDEPQVKEDTHGGTAFDFL